MANTSGSSLKPSRTFAARNIAIIGASGQLGHRLAHAWGDAAVAFTRDECDLNSSASVRQAIHSQRFEWVINTAAYTNVDGAESEPELCNAINHHGVELLANECQRSGSKLIQISTDYVFGGDPQHRVPYLETDTPAAQGVYAKSKLAGEFAASQCDRHLILRTCGLYDVPNPQARCKNFCNTILKVAETRKELAIVDDQWCTPTYVPHFVEAIGELMQTDASGIVNVVNTGSATWYQVGCELIKQAGLSTLVRAIDSSQYPAAAARPAYSVLDSTKYRRITEQSLPTWREAITAYIERRRILGQLPPQHF